MQNDKLSCLIIHGFGGGVYEVKALAILTIELSPTFCH